MLLQRGTRIGSYEVVALIGVGGMGEVYLATDTKLPRSVALKILPAAFSSDPDRLARFNREAHVLASLSHSNIGGIIGLEDEGAIHALVLELVEGPTLADRIMQGALPVDEALAVARQIADALETAHELGIIHRDLKPSNIKIRHDGVVKVLDFGLAKATEPPDESVATSRLSTITTPAVTQTGVILGTAAYMSPEQAVGKRVDRRADIWAFGCVLYEMLTGRKPFRGEVVTETLGAVLHAEPDWRLLPPATPRRLETLLRRCLKKSERQRLQAIGDARIELDEILSGEAESEIARPAGPGPGWKTWGALSLAAIAIAATASLVTWNLKPTSTPRREVSRQTITLPSGQQLADLQSPILALAPDDKHLAYVATQKGESGRQIYLWSLEQGTARPVPGSAGANTPFFSEDGQWLGFYNGQNRLMKVPVKGGVAESLMEVVRPYGVSWIAGRRIAVASLGSVIRGLSDDGSTVQSLTRFQTGETLHAWPTFLPGNKAMVFTVSSTASAIAVQRFGDESHRTVVTGAGKQMPRYSPSGHLIYAQTGNLMAVPFDLEQLNVSESAVPTTVLSGLQHTSSNPLFTVSASGSLAYVPGEFRADDAFNIVRVSRSGTELKTFDAPARFYYQPRLSNDGNRLAVDVREEPALQVWLYDLVRARISPFTYPAERDNRHALWTPDSQRIVIQSGKDGTRQLFSRPANGGGLEKMTHFAPPSADADTYTIPSSFCSDGRLIFTRLVPTAELWELNTKPSSGHVPKPVRRDLPMSADGAPHLSPDCRWLAYVLDESGRREVYLRPYPSLDSKHQISTDGGTEPVWNPDPTKRELFYRNGQDMMAVQISDEGVATGKIEKLFSGPYGTAGGGYARANYDVFPDGSFLMLKPAPQHGPLTQINVVLGWPEEVKRLAPSPSR